MPAQPKPRKLRTLQLVTVIFFTVSGGPFGLEALLGYAHEHAALLLLLVTPLLWDIPAMFMVLELNSMMPVTGGYYQWVKHALGMRWGLFEGWWTWLYTFADLAIYPVLFVMYASYFVPIEGVWKVAMCLLIIWGSAGINILGIVPVGKVAQLLSIIVIAPFILLFVIFAQRHTGSFALPAPSLKGLPYPSLGSAIYIVMWNCFGWDNVTTYADEVERPERAYLRSVFMAFLLMMVVYVGVIITAQLSHIGYKEFAEKGMPALGELVAGRWLGIVLSIGGMASAIGLYAANLLAVSRLPKVMADDELMPARLHALHPRFGTPYVSIIVCSVVISLMTFWDFGDLVIIDVTIYGAGLFLEYITLIKMRIREPSRPRPFRVPLSTTWLCALLILPVGVYSIALSGVMIAQGNALKPALFAIGCLLSAEVVWRIVLWRKPHLRA
ncbi:amino acid/polyamine/organocation transporter (APC superfamily) [Mucilaginibacter yixingensis]|uniref:Amino acid/polyamine/organocation transporter (APC superfamily) n=1 Tax=Mucilaginibacter yixingensis TaxID=1295612 RepID=A0A2T5JEA0_9SPHI|nr:APC family permease [Mucilaginibacter yixingensis]PTQ99985.1 amino acid/polyamine/organocation transporter (APC superfamily) [Mucilaginibacter yixingensis]